MEDELMPDFDTRTPQESNQRNRPRIPLIASRRLGSLLSASKRRILWMASTLRRTLIANRNRSLLIGGVILLVVAAPVGLLNYSFGGFGHPQQEAEYLNDKIVFEYRSASGVGLWSISTDGSSMTP